MFIKLFEKYLKKCFRN